MAVQKDEENNDCLQINDSYEL